MVVVSRPGILLMGRRADNFRLRGMLCLVFASDENNTGKENPG